MVLQPGKWWKPFLSLSVGVKETELRSVFRRKLDAQWAANSASQELSD